MNIVTAFTVVAVVILGGFVCTILAILRGLDLTDRLREREREGEA